MTAAPPTQPPAVGASASAAPLEPSSQLLPQHTHCFPTTTAASTDKKPVENGNFVLSVVVVGASSQASYRWGLHEGTQNGYKLIRSFRTRHAQPRNGNDGNDNEALLPLADYFDEDALCWMGGPRFAKQPTLERLMLNRRRVQKQQGGSPFYFQIHLLVTSVASVEQQQEHLHNLKHLFAQIPCRFRLLDTNDWGVLQLWNDLNDKNGNNHNASGMSPLGAESILHLSAASELCRGQQTAVLVLDCGGVLTWTATNVHGVYHGGGTSPGLAARFQAMHESCQDMPLVTSQDVRDQMTWCASAREPIQYDPLDLTSPQTVMANVFREVTQSLRNIIHSWASLVRQETKENPPQTMQVILTGFDAALYQRLLAPPHVSFLWPKDDKSALMLLNRIQILVKPHLAQQGIAQCLQRCSGLGSDLLPPLEQKRLVCLGLRVQHPQPGRRPQHHQPLPFLLGTVCDLVPSISPSATSLSQDRFHVHYDNGTKETIDVVTLFERLNDFASSCGSDGGEDLEQDEEHNNKRRALEAAQALAKDISDLEVKSKLRREEREAARQALRMKQQQEEEERLERQRQIEEEELRKKKAAQEKAEREKREQEEAAERERQQQQKEKEAQEEAKQRKKEQEEAKKKKKREQEEAKKKKQQQAEAKKKKQQEAAKKKKQEAEERASSNEKRPRPNLWVRSDSEDSDDDEPLSTVLSRAASSTFSMSKSKASSTNANKSKSSKKRGTTMSSEETPPPAKKAKKAQFKSGSSSKKSRKAMPSKVVKKSLVVDRTVIVREPLSLEGRRIAKHFDETLYYGTVSSFREDEEYGKLWRIIYDDGDKEDFGASQMYNHLRLYNEHKAGDTENDFE